LRNNEWRGHLRLSHGWACYEGPAGDTSFHAHYPCQLVFARTDEASVQLEDRECRGRQLFIPSNLSHMLDQNEEPLTLLYIEPTLLDQDIDKEWSLSAWLSFLKHAEPKVEDERMISAMANIEAALNKKVSLQAVAAASGLSKSSFTALFRKTFGMPLRRYVLWRRLYLAVQAIGRGADATTAAHTAGFSDSAHFSRTMKTNFGVSPTESVLKITMSVQ